MDSLQLSEEISQLKKLSGHYEQLLKLVGLEMCDLDDDVHALLDDCVVLQNTTQLHDMYLKNLNSYYYEKKREHIEDKAKIARLKNEIKKQQEELEVEQMQCNLLEKFTAVTSKRIVSEAQMERSVSDLESNIKSLNERLNALDIPEDLNMDGVIKKVEMIKVLKNRQVN